MDRSSLEANIAAHPFLVGVREEHIKLLAECAMKTQFAAGENIFKEGETANRFYLIEEGEVALESNPTGGASTVIDTVQSGDLLGWSWLFPPYIWHFGARATKPTTAIFFYGTILREYCERDHSLGYELFKRMSEVMTDRLQSARGRLLRSYSATAKK